jgi:hypothetical protein
MEGCIIGELISIMICVFVNGTEWVDSNGLEFLRQIIGSMIYGGIAMGGSVVYEIESWSIVRVTATHYITTMISFLIANTVLGWFGTGIALWIAFICMTIGYILIWLIQAGVFAVQVREVNRELRQLHKE